MYLLKMKNQINNLYFDTIRIKAWSCLWGLVLIITTLNANCIDREHASYNIILINAEIFEYEQIKEYNVN